MVQRNDIKVKVNVQSHMPTSFYTTGIDEGDEAGGKRGYERVLAICNSIIMSFIQLKAVTQLADTTLAQWMVV